MKEKSFINLYDITHRPKQTGTIPKILSAAVRKGSEGSEGK